MDIEKVGQINKAEISKNKEEERNPIEVAIENISSIENKTEDLIIKGQKRIDAMTKEYLLPIDIIDSVFKEIDLSKRQEEIMRDADLVVGSATEIFLENIPDFSEEELDNFPIKYGEEFLPEVEIKKILKAPRMERKKLLRDYKEKLNYQKEGLAQMQEGIIFHIRQNPNTPLSELYEWVTDFGSTHGLIIEQKAVARELLLAYENKHRAIRAEREKYPDDRDLVKAIFGWEPVGEIEVIEGPITLYFRCKNLQDYTRMYKGSVLANRAPLREEMELANKSAGASLEYSLIPELQGSIIIENTPMLEGDYKKILNHEEQHAIKKLFGKKLSERNGWMRICLADTDEERVRALRDYLREMREYEAEEYARDEILAYLIGQNYSSEKIVKILTMSKEDGGLYDYLDTKKADYTSMLISKLGQEFKSVVEDEVYKIFVREYEDLILNSTEVVDKLKNFGYSPQQIVAILIQEPLTRWKKVVDRLVENK